MPIHMVSAVEPTERGRTLTKAASAEPAQRRAGVTHVSTSSGTTHAHKNAHKNAHHDRTTEALGNIRSSICEPKRSAVRCAR